MRFLPLLLVLALAVGCAGSESTDAESTGASSSTGRIGPVAMPDRELEPLEFLKWRIDRLYDNGDADGDGKLSVEEFTGDAINGALFNFERMDVNRDKFLTKQEIVDDQTVALREEGRIP